MSQYGKGDKWRQTDYKKYWERFDKIDFGKNRKQKELEYPLEEDRIEENEPNCDQRSQSVNGG